MERSLRQNVFDLVSTFQATFMTDRYRAWGMLKMPDISREPLIPQAFRFKLTQHICKNESKIKS